MSRQLVGLGQAFELRYIRDGETRQEVVSFPDHWWAWDGEPTTGDIRLVRVVGVSKLRATARNRALFEMFHGAPPSHMVTVDAEPMLFPLTSFARATAIGYDAYGLNSNKARNPRRHYFGAFFHGDKPPFPDDALPDVVLDSDNQLMLKRRRSNTFRLEEWIVG